MTRTRKSTPRQPARTPSQIKESPAASEGPESFRGGVSGPKAASRARRTTAHEGSQTDGVADAMCDDEDGAEASDVDLDDLEFDPNARDILGDFGLDDEEAVPEESDFWFDADDEFED